MDMRKPKFKIQYDSIYTQANIKENLDVNLTKHVQTLDPKNCNTPSKEVERGLYRPRTDQAHGLENPTE